MLSLYVSLLSPENLSHFLFFFLPFSFPFFPSFFEYRGLVKLSEALILLLLLSSFPASVSS